MGSILIVDDDSNCLATMEMVLTEEGFNVVTASDGEEALKYFQLGGIDLVISDIQMPNLNGEKLLQAIKRFDRKAVVILVTAHSSLDAAAQAVINGAYDYLSKPIDINELINTINKALNHRKMLVSFKKDSNHMKEFPNQLIGRSRTMLDLFKTIGKVAPSDSTVLILGESGTGKELVARQIHRLSNRSDKKFIAVNCGALTETLLESELFGHVRGAFTGAVSDRNGLFREADGGTIFLDEITETSPAFQMKLLRVLQEGEILSVGTSFPKKINVRIIAATNQDIDYLVQTKKFRADVLYRLRVITLLIPPLRERREDIPLLADFFNKKYTPVGEDLRQFSPGLKDILQSYDWPGNVRELENAIESAVILSRGSFITLDEMPEKIRLSKQVTLSLKESTKESIFNYDELPELVSLSELEYKHTQRVLEVVSGNKSRAARILGIDRKTLERIVSRSNNLANRLISFS
jgi:DNA-binding NtrC family response regulator